MLFSKYSLICSRSPLFSTVIVRICQDIQSPSQLAETAYFTHWFSCLFFTLSSLQEGAFSSVLREKNLTFLILPQNQFQNTRARNDTSSRGEKKRFWLNILQARRRENEVHYKLERCSLRFFNVSHSYITWWSVSIVQTRPKIHV